MPFEPNTYKRSFLFWTDRHVGQENRPTNAKSSPVVGCQIKLLMPMCREPHKRGYVYSKSPVVHLPPSCAISKRKQKRNTPTFVLVVRSSPPRSSTPSTPFFGLCRCQSRAELTSAVLVPPPTIPLSWTPLGASFWSASKSLVFVLVSTRTTDLHRRHR